MKPEGSEHADRVFEIFQAAVVLNEKDRAVLLDRECEGEAELRKEVEELLASDKRAEGFIESRPFDETLEWIENSEASVPMLEAVGPFKIVSRLGSGGMGDVYLAEDSRLGRKVALKLLRRSLVDDTQSRSRFIREARLASALDHPNICTIHEIGDASGVLFIAMQYVEGQTLKQVINDQPSSLDSLVSVTMQVGNALAAAHSQGIIHRDIKSSNIMITPRGQAKVLDFGLARPMKREDGVTDLTLDGAVMGTPSYMSPEQSRGERADHRSDIFSFGVVMYEMATGRAPFKAGSLSETINAVINEPHTSVAELNRDVPQELSAVIDRSLAKRPEDRYQSIQAMIDDFRRAAQTTGSIGPLSSDAFATSYVPAGKATRGGFRQWIAGAVRKPVLLIGLVTILIALTLLIYAFKSRPSSAPRIKSIAVLPFKPLVAGDRDEPLEMGMADSLISRLSNLTEINVRPISAVRKYSDIQQDALAAGREQKVDAVVDGQIQKSGDGIRVTVRFMRIDDGRSIWASQFDEKMTNIFRVQDSISERVASAVALKLTAAEREGLTRQYTENTEAYELYLKGRYHLNRLTDDGFLKALEYFQQVVEKDPKFALAHVGVAESYSDLAGFNVRSPNEMYPKAKSAALTALKLDHKLPEAYAVLAVIKLAYDWDWVGAEQEYKRALEFNPTNSDAHQQYSFYLTCMGRFDEALAEAKRAEELDPVSLSKIASTGQVLVVARRYDDAIGQIRKALDMDPNLGFAHWLLGLAYMYKGDYDRAIPAFQKSIPLSGDSPDEPASLALAYAQSGKLAEARKILSELKQQSKRTYVSPSVFASLYLAIGESDQAFAWFDKAFNDRDNMMILLKVEPYFDPFRSDPRFTKLLERVGFKR